MTNASSSKMSVEEMISHYQRSIERSQNDPKRILHCIGKLHRMSVTVQHLQSTGIGRTVNSLRKDDGPVGAAAKSLISKWKQMVASEASDCEEEKAEEEYAYEDDESSKLLTEPISNKEKKSHKTHEHGSNSGSNNNNHQHHHHHHRDQYRELDKVNDGHSHKRKYSSDDTDEQISHSKHKHKSHGRDEGSKGSKKRENNQENYSAVNDDRQKSGSSHSKEDRHHHSRHEAQSNGEESSDKKHRSESRDQMKHSSHHKSHSSSNEKTHSSSKHKRSRDHDHAISSPKKQKCDSSKSEEKKSSKSKHKQEDGIEIDNSMGTSFADALGMLEPPKPTHSSKPSTSTATSAAKVSSKSSTASSASGSSKTTKVKEKLKSSKPSTSSTTATPSLLLKKPKLPPLDDLAKDLPPPPECIITNDYKPSPVNHMVMDVVFKATKSQPMMLNETAALCASTTSKNQRTKVYSGVKTGALLTVSSLHELCIRFLQKNIDGLEYTGGVPFDILKPVLERATPEQLSLFEHYNPYLMEDSDVLWQQHCQRKFKAYKRQEMETWREMYYRCQNEQEARLNSLTSNIKKSQSVAIPVRQTKLAYVDSMVKPPRSVIKKQNQFGTHAKLIATPAARVEALSTVASNMARVGDTRLKTLASLRDTAQAQPSNGVIKPKKAPLMAKTLQLMKGRFKR